MPDDLKKKGLADRMRVALSQKHERTYTLVNLDNLANHLMQALADVEEIAARVRAGFPSKKPKRGKR